MRLFFFLFFCIFICVYFASPFAVVSIYVSDLLFHSLARLYNSQVALLNLCIFVGHKKNTVPEERGGTSPRIRGDDTRDTKACPAVGLAPMTW